MARIRTIKPEIAAHEVLFDLELETRLPIRFAWCMLFTVADREGRFAWRPRTLKAQILPHDEVDFSRVLDAWVTRAFIVKYRVKSEWFGWIPTFTKHQVINNRESPSDLPSIEVAEEIIDNRGTDLDACPTREGRDDDACPTREVHAQAEGRKEGKGKDASSTRQRTPPKSTAKPIPDDFDLTPDRQTYAEKHLPHVDPIALMATFRSTSKAKGWKYVDWDQHWQTLVRQWGPNSGHWSSGQYPRKPVSASEKPRDPSDPDDLIHGRRWQ